MQKPKTKIWMIILIIIDLALSGGYYFWFQNIQSRGQNISSLTNKIDFSLNQESRLRGIEAVLADTQSDRELIRSYIVDKDGVVKFVESVESLGKSVGVEVNINSLGVESVSNSSVSNTQYLTLTIAGVADWSSISRFIGMVETMPYVVSVKSLILNQSGETKSMKPAWQSIIKLSVLKQQ